MAFSGTPITATENQGQYTCHLSEAQFVGEPNIDRAIGDTATAFYASNSLLIFIGAGILGCVNYMTAPSCQGTNSFCP